jgi:flagellar hook assembly protein FlgD
VFNSAGEIVKTISVTQYSFPIQNVTLASSDIIASLEDKINIIFQGTNIGVWDGTNNAGQPVNNGQYYIKIDNVDPMGNVTSVTEPAVVSRKVAQLQVVVFNSAGEEVRQLAQTEVDSMALSSNAQISNSVITPSNLGGVNNTTTLSLSSGISFVWDGRNDAGQIVGAGQYYFEIKSTDGQGSESEFSQSVVVMPVSTKVSNSGITVYPNPTNPSVYGNLVTFKDPTASLTLSVRLYTLAGELAAMPALVNTGGGLYTLDISKLASGLYIADIVMTNSSGSSQRQVTRLVILH